MRKAAFLLAAATLSVALVGCSTSGTNKSKDATTLSSATPRVSSTVPTETPTSPASSSGKGFTSPDGYSIEPPAGWKRRTDVKLPGVSSFFGAPAVDKAARFLDNINVAITPSRADLETTIAASKRLLPTVLTHYRAVIDEPITADGQEAYLLGGTFEQGTLHLENLQLLLISGGKQYTVTFTCPAASFKRLQKLAQASMSTIHVL